ncbi:MAG: DinB family protein [Sphingobacteriales bacterium]|nr:MAG: DinB family protein [Sphingobacteriales bacterium]
MKKSDIKKMPAYFDRYIYLTDDVSYSEALQISLQELETAPKDKWIALGEKVYAVGKWTVKDILRHLIDTERVFAYRITAIARGDKQQMTPFDEEAYAENTTANSRTVEDLLAELILVRKGTISMFQFLTPDMLHQTGNGFNGMQYCPLSLGFMLAGHQRWHFKVLEERYYGLLS